MSENLDRCTRSTWTERCASKWWNGLHHSPTPWTIRSRFTEGKLANEKVGVNQHSSSLAAQEEMPLSRANTQKITWWYLTFTLNHWINLGHWERGKFWVALHLDNCWLSIRPAEKPMGFVEICVLLDVVLRTVPFGMVVAKDDNDELCSFCWWRALCRERTTSWSILHLLKCLFSKIFRPKFKFGS